MAKFRHKENPQWNRKVSDAVKGIDSKDGLIKEIKPRVEIQFENGYFSTEDAYIIKFIKALPDFQMGKIVDADLEDKLNRRKKELSDLIEKIMALEDEADFKTIVEIIKTGLAKEKIKVEDKK